VGVAEEANGGVLVGETGGGGQLVKDVAPSLRAVQRGVNDGKTRDHPRILQIPQPLLVVVAQHGVIVLRGGRQLRGRYVCRTVSKRRGAVLFFRVSNKLNLDRMTFAIDRCWLKA